MTSEVIAPVEPPRHICRHAFALSAKETDMQNVSNRTPGAYAVAHLRNVRMGADIVAYLEGIDATLAPFGGRFVIHGGAKTVLEGDWPGDLIVIGFPDRAAAESWYESDAYRRIAPLRTRNSEGDIILVDGVPDDHRAIDILAP
jgi:uncharacterized protein (DUF1330 family)